MSSGNNRKSAFDFGTVKSLKRKDKSCNLNGVQPSTSRPSRHFDNTCIESINPSNQNRGNWYSRRDNFPLHTADVSFKSWKHMLILSFFRFLPCLSVCTTFRYCSLRTSHPPQHASWHEWLKIFNVTVNGRMGCFSITPRYQDSWRKDSAFDTLSDILTFDADTGVTVRSESQNWRMNVSCEPLLLRRRFGKLSTSTGSWLKYGSESRLPPGTVRLGWTGQVRTTAYKVLMACSAKIDPRSA